MLKEQKQSECKPVMTKLKGKLILDKDCDDKKKRSRVSSKKWKKSRISKLKKQLGNIK